MSVVGHGSHWLDHSYGRKCEKPFFTFVGEKCCNTTIFDPQQLKTVGVGLTFQPFVGATFTKSVGPTKFPQQKRESNSNTNSS